MVLAPTLEVRMIIVFLKSIFATLAIGERSFFQNLQKQVHDIGMRFLDLIEENH